MEKFDIAIIGTGPAGLSCAITSKIRNKKVIIFGNNDLSMKVAKAEMIENYLGLPHISGKELQSAFTKHLQQLDIQITDDFIVGCYTYDDHFILQGKNGQYDTTSVVIASGVNFGTTIPGEEEFLGRGVSYCATCDAPLYKNKDIVCVSYTKESEHEIEFLASICNSVKAICLYQDHMTSHDNIEVLEDRPLKFEGMFKANKLVTKDREITSDGFFVFRKAVKPSSFVPGLTMEDNHLVVDRLMKTQIKGIFACGDIVGKPYQYIKAAGEGNIAAISAVEYIDNLTKENK